MKEAITWTEHSVESVGEMTKLCICVSKIIHYGDHRKNFMSCDR